MLVLCITAGIIFVLWMGYSGWAAPLMRENEDGSWTTLRPQKKFSDLFKKQTPTKNEDVFVDKDAFKKLAGIGIPKSADTTNTDLLKYDGGDAVSIYNGNKAFSDTDARMYGAITYKFEDTISTDDYAHPFDKNNFTMPIKGETVII